MTPFWQNITIAIVSALGSGGFVSLVQFFVTRHDKAKEKEDEEQSETSKMILALGHDKIAYLTRKFIRRGGITQTEMANLAGLYAPYRAAHSFEILSCQRLTPRLRPCILHKYLR